MKSQRKNGHHIERKNWKSSCAKDKETGKKKSKNDHHVKNIPSLEISKIHVYGIPGILALILYLNTLSAGFVYDDHRAIVSNPDVIGSTPLSSLWHHDFWGAPLLRKGSHGSWRPLTTLSFRLNGIFLKRFDTVKELDHVSTNKLPPSTAVHFHAVNIIIHSLSTLSYVWLLNRIGIPQIVSLYAGSLFAAHPVHVEAVAGLVGRTELLAALAFCLALGAYIQYLKGKPYFEALYKSCYCLTWNVYSSETAEKTRETNWLWLWASVLLNAIGVMCKEQSITAIIVGIILHSALIILYTRRKKNIIFIVFQEIGPSLLLAGFLTWWRISTSTIPSFTVTDNPAAYASSTITRCLTIMRYWAEDARLLLVPDVLSFDWSMEAIPCISSVYDIRNIRGLSLLLVLSALVYQTVKKLNSNIRNYPKTLHLTCQDALNNNRVDVAYQRKECREPIIMMMCLSLAIIPFLPASNLFLYVGFAVAERVLYIPSMGIALLVAYGADKLDDILRDTKTRKRVPFLVNYCNHQQIKWAVPTAWSLLILLMGLRTIRRNIDWQTDESLYQSGVRVCPAKAWANLGVVYSDQGRLIEAERSYSHAISAAPKMAETHYNLGLLLTSTNRMEEAVISYKEALNCRPWLVQAHLALSSTLTRIGKNKAAQEVLHTCVQHANAPAKDGMAHAWAVTTCRQRRARLFLINDSPNKALEELQRAFKEAPPGYPLHTLWTLQAEIYVTAGEHTEAKQALTMALAAQPSDIPAHIAYSRLLQANGSKLEEAEVWLKRATSLAPNDAHVLKHYGQILLEQGRAEEAIEPWMKAIHLEPSDHVSIFNAATSLRLSGRNSEAEQFYRKAVFLVPQDLPSQRNLGAILHLNGKLQEAKHHYDIALRLTPGDPQTIINLQRLNTLMKKKNPL